VFPKPKKGFDLNMKKIFSIFIVAISFATFAFGQCSDADKKALEAFDRAWGNAGQSGDRAALMNIYADDYMGFPGMQNKMQTIEGTMKQAEKDKANPAMADKISHDSYMISCTPNSATITHRNIVTAKDGDGGKEETFWTRSIHFLEKRNGRWQVVSSTGHAMDDYMTLGYLEQDWNTASLNRDKAWFEKHFASDYSSISSRDAALTDKAADIKDVMSGSGGATWYELSNLSIRIDGKTAIVTGVNHVKGKDEKGPYEIKVRFTDTWIKRDGRWQAWATQGTRMP
jgi:ketosteroid isomerase-like protein